MGHTHYTIALDAMGGDHAPESWFQGASYALQKVPNLRFIMVGDEELFAPLFKKYRKVAEHSTTLHTKDAIADDEKPSTALRQGKHSSMQLAINQVKGELADAVVSGGNTGALMAMAKLSLRMLPGIKRPAAAGPFPTQKGDCIMLDLGANLSASAEELLQFAIMGDVYAKAALGKQAPRIALLNVGEEDTKGHSEIREAAELIRTTRPDLNFIGFVEGHHVTEGRADVIVADGFTGNIFLKSAEGTAKMMRNHIKAAFSQDWITKLSYLLTYKTMRNLRKRLDPRRYNGAIFLGLNGVAIKSHGSADAYAVSQAIRKAAGLLQHATNQHIIDELNACATQSEALDSSHVA